MIVLMYQLWPGNHIQIAQTRYQALHFFWKRSICLNRTQPFLEVTGS